MNKHAFHKQHTEETIPVTKKMVSLYHDAHTHHANISGNVTRLTEIEQKLSAIPHPPEDKAQADAITALQADMIKAYDALHGALNHQVQTYESIMGTIPKLVNSLRKQHEHLK